MVGIARMFEGIASSFLLQDVLARDLMDMQALVCFFLSSPRTSTCRRPEFGEELEIGLKPSTPEFLALSADREIHSRAAPQSEVFYKPCTGDLVFFDSGRVHQCSPIL